mmetsp:Transcript_827/g.2474  ORF Transcript_827/g.2474 Transcript_827/m.2474 type:complete len:358 (-) Transcript_827:14-1087(-)
MVWSPDDPGFAAGRLVCKLGLESAKAANIAQRFLAEEEAEDFHHLDETNRRRLACFLRGNGVSRVGSLSLDEFLNQHLDAHMPPPFARHDAGGATESALGEELHAQPLPAPAHTPALDARDAEGACCAAIEAGRAASAAATGALGGGGTDELPAVCARLESTHLTPDAAHDYLPALNDTSDEGSSADGESTIRSGSGTHLADAQAREDPLPLAPTRMHKDGIEVIFPQEFVEFCVNSAEQNAQVEAVASCFKFPDGPLQRMRVAVAGHYAEQAIRAGNVELGIYLLCIGHPTGLETKPTTALCKMKLQQLKRTGWVDRKATYNKMLMRALVEDYTAAGRVDLAALDVDRPPLLIEDC